jgi:hypothetical protein
MRSSDRLPGANGQRTTSGDRWISLGTALCLAVLIAASGPHLVHHLADLSAEHSYSHPHRLRSTDCLVLSLMQHMPLSGEYIFSLLPSLPPAEQASSEPALQIIRIHRPTVQARAPPATSRASTELP